MTRGKFGAFKPKNLGAEPAAIPDELRDVSTVAVLDGIPIDVLRSIKVLYSSRITVAAQRQLSELVKRGHSQVDLLAEALNLLFKRYGLDQVG